MKIILLIDDNEGIRLTFGTVLRSRGYRVIESDSGEAGMELARQHLPDLILSDINMPGGDGQALLQHIRADPQLASKQVVLMTGRPDMVSPRRGMEQGADDFLVKPISKEALLSCVEARLNRADIHWRVEDRALATLRSSMTSQFPHEFFTPLAGILGLSELLSNDISTLSLDEIQDLNKDIHQAAQRLHRTLRNYLLILESPAEPVARTLPARALSPSNLKQCLKTAINLVVERQGRKDDLIAEWKECPLRVEASDLALIVEELLDNAFKFSRVGSPVHLRLEEDGSLVITDAGRGMSPEQIEKIGAFQQFNRRKLEQQGLGLGLVLVQKLASRCGATFSVVKGLEQGIQARVSFPLGAQAI